MKKKRVAGNGENRALELLERAQQVLPFSPSRARLLLQLATAEVRELVEIAAAYEAQQQEA